MSSTPILPEDNPPENWLGVAAGLVIFLIADLMLILNEIPLAAQPASWAWTLRILSIWGMILVPAVGFTIGWIKSFPRWTYPCPAGCVFFIIHCQRLHTGLYFPLAIQRSTPTWGLRAFILLLLGGLIAWLVTRSLNLSRDFLPRLARIGPGKPRCERHITVGDLIAYDEMDQAYSLIKHIHSALQLM
jgi:hypothetical protein